MRLILLGLPGAGKGTQANNIAERQNLLHVSTGDMFRDAAAEGTDLGKRAQEYMSVGELVPDEVTIGMLLERIGKPDAVQGFMLDGFPRTIAQAEALDAAMGAREEQVDGVLYIKVPEQDLMARLTGRWSCPECGAIYHVMYSPPKSDGYCDTCSDERLIQRPDDSPETVQQRLTVNREQTEALAEYYDRTSKLLPIDGTGEPSEVTERLLTAIDGVSPAARKA